MRFPGRLVFGVLVGVRMLSAQAGALADIEAGARLFQANCSTCHGPDGDAVQGINFARGKYKRVGPDTDFAKFITGGIPGTAMPPFDLNVRQVAQLVAYFRSERESASLPAAAGDARRGQALFAGKGACTTCHRIDSTGSRVGPDLSDIGRIRPAASIEESIVNPDAVVLPEHLYCRVVTRAGETVIGRRLNEDPNSIQLIDSGERLRSFEKSGLREVTVLAGSQMPSYREKLTTAEIADVVKYLTTRKGSPVP